MLVISCTASTTMRNHGHNRHCHDAHLRSSAFICGSNNFPLASLPMAFICGSKDFLIE
jgi:hypothetical protein